MFEKHLWKSDILSKDAGHAPGFYISETLVENGLKINTVLLFIKPISFSIQTIHKAS